MLRSFCYCFCCYQPVILHHPCHSLDFSQNHSPSNMAIICGPASFAAQFGNPLRSWGPFLERPGNLTGPVSYFEIKFARKVCCVLTSKEAHFVSLANNFTVLFSKLLELPSSWKTKQLNGSGNYRELRETGSRTAKDSQIGRQMIPDSK